MLRSALIDIWPLALFLALTLGALATLVRRCAPHAQWRSLAALHGDQSGAVQSLSFVLTVPFFVMLMLFVVQVTQLMIALMVVHYAAFAAARSASVWIPADAGPDEPPNCISSENLDRTVPNGVEYLLQANSTGKFERIRLAAALACTPIAPSRDLGLAAGGDPMATSVIGVYQALAPSSTSNARLPQRLANKWAYANQYTAVKIRIFHRDDEPALQWYDIPPFRDEFRDNEIGFRDKIQVTVSHRFALLPGPGRFLYRPPPEPPAPQPRPPPGRRTGPPPKPSPPGPWIPWRPPEPEPPKYDEKMGNVYYVPLSAVATLGNEGEKSWVPYAQTSP